MADVIDPRSNSDDLGDLADPWSLWLEGEIDLTDLPEDLQKKARELLDQG